MLRHFFNNKRRRVARRQCPLELEVLERRDVPAVTVTDAPQFQLNISAGESVAVRTNGDMIAWTVDGVLNTGATPANSIVSLTVTATARLPTAST